MGPPLHSPSARGALQRFPETENHRNTVALRAEPWRRACPRPWPRAPHRAEPSTEPAPGLGLKSKTPQSAAEHKRISNQRASGWQGGGTTAGHSGCRGAAGAGLGVFSPLLGSLSKEQLQAEPLRTHVPGTRLGGAGAALATATAAPARGPAPAPARPDPAPRVPCPAVCWGGDVATGMVTLLLGR